MGFQGGHRKLANMELIMLSDPLQAIRCTRPGARQPEMQL
jgi:hypothetical protein